MSDFVIVKVMELAEKMAKVEQMYLTLAEGHKEQASSIKDLGVLMLDIKESIGKLDGRTEKGDTNVNFESNTNVDGADNVNNETTVN